MIVKFILMGKRELVALLNVPSWCLMMVERLFLAVPGGSLQFVIVVFPDHTHLLILFKVTSSCYIAPQFIQGLLEAYLKIKKSMVSKEKIQFLC